MNTKRKLEKMKKAVYNTQFKMETEGPEHVHIEIRGCQMGAVIKMAIALSELVKMEAIELDDIDNICESAKELAKDELKINKSHCKMVEITGDLAEELYDLLQQVQKGKISENDIDFESFMKRAKGEDNSL